MAPNKSAGSHRASRPLSIDASRQTIDSKSKPSPAPAQRQLLIPIGRVTERLVIRIDEEVLDLRIFTDGAGPAAIPMPTRQGFVIPAEMLSRLIAALQGLLD